MRNTRLSWIALLLLIAGTHATLAQQTRQRKVLVKKEMSLTKTDNKTVIATESIVFESGFEAKEGCSFYASVIDAENFTHKNTEGVKSELLVEPLKFEAYPTITADKVNLTICGATNPVITVHDERNGAEIFRSTDGTLSEVSLAVNGRGTYVIKVVSGEGTLFKRVIVR